MATAKRKSRILEEMHETARGLHKIGLIDKRRMGEFEALCGLAVHEIPPQKRSSSYGKRRMSARLSLPLC